MGLYLERYALSWTSWTVWTCQLSEKCNHEEPSGDMAQILFSAED